MYQHVVQLFCLWSTYLSRYMVNRPNELSAEYDRNVYIMYICLDKLYHLKVDIYSMYEYKHIYILRILIKAFLKLCRCLFVCLYCIEKQSNL